MAGPSIGAGQRQEVLVFQGPQKKYLFDIPPHLKGLTTALQTLKGITLSLSMVGLWFLQKAGARGVFQAIVVV